MEDGPEQFAALSARIRAASACAVMAALLLCAGLATAAEAGQEPPSRTVQIGSLEALLNAPHPQVTALQLRRVGPDVGSLLVEFATSPDATPPVRMRALAWLQYFPSTQTKAVLLETLRARDVSVPVQRIVLRTLAAGFGTDVLELVREYLTHRNLYVREAAAYAMGDIDDSRVPGILNDSLGREPEVVVRDAISASLQRLSRRHAAPARRTRAPTGAP